MTAARKLMAAMRQQDQGGMSAHDMAKELRLDSWGKWHRNAERAGVSGYTGWPFPVFTGYRSSYANEDISIPDIPEEDAEHIDRQVASLRLINPDYVRVMVGIYIYRQSLARMSKEMRTSKPNIVRLRDSALHLLYGMML